MTRGYQAHVSFGLPLAAGRQSRARLGSTIVIIFFSCSVEPSGGVVGKAADAKKVSAEICPKPKAAGLKLQAGEDATTYLGHIEPLLKAKCQFCHSANAPVNLRAAPYLTDYVSAFNNAYKIQTQLKLQSMPKANSPGPAWAATDPELVNKWIAVGRPQGVAGPVIDQAPDQPGAKVYAYTYDENVKPYLAINCVNCHKPLGDSPDLSQYEYAVQNARASLASMNLGTMPKGGVKAQQPIIDMVARWLADGTPKSNVVAPDPEVVLDSPEEKVPENPVNDNPECVEK